MNIRNIYDATFHANLILPDLNLPPESEDTTINAGLPHEIFGELLLRQILVIKNALDKKPEELEKQHSGSKLYSVIKKIQLFTSILSSIDKQKDIHQTISQSTLNILKKQALPLHEKAQTLELHIKSHLIEKAKIQGSGSIKRAVFGMFSNYIGSPILSWFSADHIKILNSTIEENESKLLELNKTHIPPQAAHTIAKLIIGSLKNQIFFDEKQPREAILRAPFLQKVFEDPTISNPQPTPLGIVLINILQDHSELIEKVITANLMKGFYSIYSKIDDLKKNDEWHLVRFFNSSFKEILDQIDPVDGAPTTLGTDARKKFITGEFQKKLTHALIDFTFPQGMDDLIVPFWSTIPKDYQNQFWDLIKEQLKDQINDTFRSFSETEDLKKLLLSYTLETTHSLLSGTVGASPDQPLHTILSPTQGVASLGILFVCIQIFFSTISSLIFSINPLQTAQTQDTTPNQNVIDFKAHILRFIKVLNTRSDSYLINLISWLFDHTLTEKLGSQLIEKMKEVQLNDLITQLLEKLLSQNGRWLDLEKKKFSFEFTPPPSTLEELAIIQFENNQERKDLDEKLETAKKTIGTNIQKLVQTLNEQVSLEIPPPISVDASQAEQFIATVQKLVIEFTNLCSQKFIEFCFWLLDVQSKLHNLGTILHERIDSIEQDSLLIGLAQFCADKLQARQQTQTSIQV